MSMCEVKWNIYPICGLYKSLQGQGERWTIVSILEGNPETLGLYLGPIWSNWMGVTLLSVNCIFFLQSSVDELIHVRHKALKTIYFL